MKTLIYLLLTLTVFKAHAVDETSRLQLSNPSKYAISSGLFYENLGSQNFMLQVGAAYKTRPSSHVGIAGGISPTDTEPNKESFVQLFWENKNWLYSVNYNWLHISKFASAGIGYNFRLYQDRKLNIRSGLGFDIIAQQLPSDFMVRMGLISFAPKLGVSVAYDL